MYVILHTKEMYDEPTESETVVLDSRLHVSIEAARQHVTTHHELLMSAVDSELCEIQWREDGLFAQAFHADEDEKFEHNWTIVGVVT